MIQLYVGNLPYSVSDSELKDIFANYDSCEVHIRSDISIPEDKVRDLSEELESMFGESKTVVLAKVIMDRETGRSRGFGFVEMPAEPAREAVQKLNGKEFDGRAIVVNEARPRAERPSANRWSDDGNSKHKWGGR